MANPTEVVQQFLRDCEPAFGYRTAVGKWFSDDCIYENIGVTRSTGVAEAIGVLDAFNQTMGFASLKVDMLALAATGNQVLTERIDYLCDAQGKILAPIRLMGIFEVRDGRITAWRDYFDTVPFQPK